MVNIERNKKTKEKNNSSKLGNKIGSYNNKYLYVKELDEAFKDKLNDIHGKRIIKSLDVKKKGRGESKKSSVRRKKNTITKKETYLCLLYWIRCSKEKSHTYSRRIYENYE